MQGKNIVLGVSGGIAAYKACELASRLTQQGAIVHVVMTAGAQRFVTPLTFQALTHQPVHVSLWPDQNAGESGVYAAMAHIGLADAAAAVIVAPASANLIARLAHGLADDLLTTLILATRAPVLVAPTMNPSMLAHPATQRNISTLSDLGYTIIDPESGRMACEHVGSGRLPTTDVLIAALGEALEAPAQSLAGVRVLVTAGPTREAIDPVRFISNRSSGKMGFALATAAASLGATVTLVAGPGNRPTPAGVRRVDVVTVAEMQNAVLAAAAESDIVIGAAAPADFTIASPAPQKIKKQQVNGGLLHLDLTPAPDIIAAVAARRRPGQFIIGFAAETHDTVAAAREKLVAKGLDAIVANDVSQADAGFDVDTNRVVWITPDKVEEWPLLSKREVAVRILQKLAAVHR